MAYTIPPMPVEFSIWRFSNWAGVVPPVNPADITDNCNLTPGRREWTQSGGGVSYIIVSQALDIRFSEDLAFTVLPAADPDLVEVPTGSGRYYVVYDVEQLGMGFPNWHQEAAIVKQGPWVPGPPPAGELWLEDGTDYLLEDGSIILLE
jgi:hypothetical protein